MPSSARLPYILVYFNLWSFFLLFFLLPPLFEDRTPLPFLHELPFFSPLSFYLEFWQKQALLILSICN